MISIIIPAYNRSRLLPETLDSILNQSDPRWECLIIDDGSEDDTWSVLEDYAQKDNRIRIFKRVDLKKTKGANACRNIGIEYSKGDYLIFFDSDDLMFPDCILNHRELIHSSKPDLSILNSVYFGQELEHEKPVISGDLFASDLVEKFFKKEVVWLTHNPSVSKDFLLKNEIRFEESLQAGQDWEFFMKIILHKPLIITSDYVGVKMRIHSNTISKDNSGKAKKYYNYYKARNLVFYRYLPEVEKGNLLDYYKNYSNEVAIQLIKLNEHEWAKEIIKNESKGFRRFSNLFFHLIYIYTKKGLSKIDLS